MEILSPVVVLGLILGFVWLLIFVYRDSRDANHLTTDYRMWTGDNVLEILQRHNGVWPPRPAGWNGRAHYIGAKGWDNAPDDAVEDDVYKPWPNLEGDR